MVEKFSYGFLMDVSAPAQIVTALAQLITVPAQPPHRLWPPLGAPATRAVVYEALFLFFFLP